MEESFSLTWEDPGTVQNEEVICIEETEILPEHTVEYQTTDEVPENGQDIQIGNMRYLSDGNVLVINETDGNVFTENFMDCQVEEVVAEQWEDNCQEEIVVGSSGVLDASNEDIEIPLPTDQDEYTAARPYPCDFCSRRFRKKANLMNHMVSHQSDRPHGCNLCGVRYIRKCDLMNHLKIHAYIPETETLEEEDIPLDDSDEKYRKSRKSFNKKRKKMKIKEEFDSFETDEMGASSSRNYFNDDLMNVKSYDYMPSEASQTAEIRYPVTDHRKPFVCQHCGVGFAREKALASHARIHGGDSPFECHKCNEMFWDMGAMREHWKTKHGGMEDYDDDEDEDYSEEESMYGTFYCTTCGLSFHRQDNLKRHQRIHVKDELMSPPEIDSGHICNVCGESFPEALDLLAHAEIHARGTEHRCMICGEDFDDDQGCAVHVQEKHGNDLPPNTCMLCGRQCKDRRALLKHSWEHSKEKVFPCSKCAKPFHNKARLKRHMLSHRNKVVTCAVCGEEFPDGRSLMNHRHSHSSVSGRQFPCRECGKTFGSRSSQQIHIRIHTGERPYGCRFCWKAFADGGTLRKHERIHTGEKPYACAVCPRAFNQRVVLREHIRSHHSGPDPKYAHTVTPYYCTVCSDMFSTSQDLIVHLIHHCDMNTAMKRQPQVGPRKYKRRRKLKPHELDLLSHREDGNELEEPQIEQQIENQPQQPEFEIEKRKRPTRKMKKSPKQETVQFEENYIEHEVYIPTNPVEESPPSSTNSKLQSLLKAKKKLKNEATPSGLPSRPKMIHTQKTRVPVEPGEDGRVRHRTKTMITRTHPTELRSSTGERIRPRTKNVSYHIFNPDKLPLATFPEDVTAVNNLLKQDQGNRDEDANPNGLLYLDQVETPEVAAEQEVEYNEPVPTNLIRVHKVQTRQSAKKAGSKPGRNVIGPGSRVRMIKSGMIVKKKVKREVPEELEEGEIVLNKENQTEEEVIQELPDEYVISDSKNSIIEEIVEEQEIEEERVTEMEEQYEMKPQIVDQSPLHELAEISMQHAQNLFKCEMCSAVFSDRAQLLVHVPIHI